MMRTLRIWVLIHFSSQTKNRSEMVHYRFVKCLPNKWRTKLKNEQMVRRLDLLLYGTHLLNFYLSFLKALTIKIALQFSSIICWIFSSVVNDLSERVSMVKLRSSEHFFLNHFCALRLLVASSSNAIRFIVSQLLTLAPTLYSWNKQVVCY